MSGKHTPGPWRVSAASLDGMKPVMAQGGGIVALVSTLSSKCELDARLIAASPALYDFAAKCAAFGDVEAQAILETIDAIAKATGDASQ